MGLGPPDQAPGGVADVVKIAAEMQGDFPDGICFVSLASIQDTGLVLPTLVQAFGLQSSSARSP